MYLCGLFIKLQLELMLSDQYLISVLLLLILLSALLLSLINLWTPVRKGEAGAKLLRLFALTMSVTSLIFSLLLLWVSGCALLGFWPTMLATTMVLMGGSMLKDRFSVSQTA